MPFWASLGFVPLIAVAAMQGGWWLLLMPIYGWGVFTAMDFLTGLNLDNPDTETPLKDLFWYPRDPRLSGSRCNSRSFSERSGGLPRPTICIGSKNCR